MSTISFVYTLLSGSFALAFTCPGAIHHDALDALKPIQAGYTCEAPPMTYEEFFRQYQKAHPEDKKTTLLDVYKKFGATGRFNCGGKMGSANVTIKNDVITLTSHSFFKKDCSPITDDFSTCNFETIPIPGKASEKIPIDPDSLVYGSDCPDASDEDDWAVVKLKRNVPDVKPYVVDGKPVVVGMKVVGAMSAVLGFRDANGYYPPAITSGEIKDATSASKWQTFMASNSAHEGSSGGAIALDSGDSLILKGIVKRGEGSDMSGTCSPYNSSNYALGVGMQGLFLRKAREAAGLE